MEQADPPEYGGIPQGKGLVHTPPTTPKTTRKTEGEEATPNNVEVYIKIIVEEDPTMTFRMTKEPFLNQEGSPQAGEIITFRYDRSLAHAISQINQNESPKIWVEEEIENILETTADSPFYNCASLLFDLWFGKQNILGFGLAMCLNMVELCRESS